MFAAAAIVANLRYLPIRCSSSSSSSNSSDGDGGGVGGDGDHGPEQCNNACLQWFNIIRHSSAFSK